MRAALRFASARGALAAPLGRSSSLAVQSRLLALSPAALQVAARRAAASVPQPSSAPVQLAWASAGGALSPDGLHGGGSLAQLQERAGFLPRPEEFDERLKPGFRGAKALLVFFLCNAMPLVAVLWYLREQRANRSQLSLGVLPADAEDVAAEVMRVIRTSGISFLMQEDTPAGAGNGGILRVDPHAPEGSAYIPPTEPLPLVPQMERNDLTDIFESPPVAGLCFIHFAVSRNSPFGTAILAGHRRASLLYVSNTRGAYCTIGGQISVLSDPESRRHYWKNIWASSFPAAIADIARPGAPSAAAPAQGAAPPAEVQAPPLWQNPDYILVRLAVAEATLRPALDGPGRWDSRRILRRSDMDGRTAEGGAKWTLAAPAA